MIGSQNTFLLFSNVKLFILFLKTSFINVNFKSMPVGKMTTKKVAVKSGSGGKTMMSKSTTKKTIPVNSATRAKYTDMQKKETAIKGGPGVKVAPKGTTMGTAQRNAAKAKAEDFKNRHGSYPTPEFMKKNPRLR